MEPLPIFTDDQIRNISVPLQFFGGDHDSLIDSVRTAKRIKTYYPSADVHILEDTGHVILDQFENIFSFFKKTII
jgi:pimeloyl-ACP methyl ester carboxylesterase